MEELQGKLVAAMASSSGMGSVDRELARMRAGQTEAVDEASGQLAVRDAQARAAPRRPNGFPRPAELDYAEAALRGGSWQSGGQS